MRKQLEIFTDGACRGNPGAGGWGALLRFDGVEEELCGAEHQTTNNRMELMAAIKALESLTEPASVCLTTDSIYVKEGITSWISGWKRRHWKTASNKPVKNQDLWQQLDRLSARHEVQWCWVKGHSGHPENERADALANQAIDRLLTMGRA